MRLTNARRHGVGEAVALFTGSDESNPLGAGDLDRAGQVALDFPPEPSDITQWRRGESNP